jgi:RNA polymerase sigma factor (sigma-70 family)
MTFFRNQPELLASFRQGRRDVLARVYRAYARPVERYLGAMARHGAAQDLAQPSAIADLLQEVFIKAFSADARRAYDELHEYGPYLSVVARNCFIDALRARGREVLKPPEQMPVDLEAVFQPSATRDPEVLVVLYQYLSQLPSALKCVYEQRFVLGRSQDDTCSALGVSRRRVRTLEERLRSGLRKALVKSGISPRDLHASRGEMARRLPHHCAATLISSRS